ncbi:MAG TPA: ABC transporter ATP-binding protein [Polyangia bacterium]|jgi:NitT/TauT family transport system ATP-binding protein|nr:ABC transporter ATP-binding protein [Polyangia bacterium]
MKLRFGSDKSEQPGASVLDVAAGLELRDVGMTYGAGPEAREVVARCSFRAERGRFTVMIGPSGAGKSTLIRLIAGFERPTSGAITLDGRPITKPGPDRQVVFQETALFPWMTTLDNVHYGPSARGELTSVNRARADQLLDKVGLSAFRARYPAHLSGGMKRRAELARALINDPAIMILDEPFRGLDAMTKRLMLEYYARLSADAGRTNFFVTTDVDEAIFLADRLLVMTHIPTRVRAVIDVDLPRPRRFADLAGDDRANQIKMTVLSLLHEEVMKSFTSGSRAATDFIDAYRRRLGPTVDNRLSK